MVLKLQNMKSKSLYISFILVILLALVFVYFAIFYDALPKHADAEWTLKEVRELVKNDRVLPQKINSLLIAEGIFPSCFVIAGCGENDYLFQFRVFEIEYPAKTIIVDPVHDERLQLENGLAQERFYQQAYDQMQGAMLRADKIVMTHEHYDHIGGLTESAYKQQLAKKAVITREQLQSNAPAKPGFSKELLAIPVLDYEKYYHLDNGIVLIKAPAHTPGSQMIFVKLQDGTEVLFTGDTVWHSDNLKKQKSKPLLISWIGGENVGLLGREIRALIDVDRKGRTHLLISHDKALLDQYLASGLIVDGLKSYADKTVSPISDYP